MVETQIAQKAGTALIWKATQHAGVKLIMLARLFILARLLSPDDFGLLAVSMVAIDVMTGVTDVGMIPALVQRRKIDETHYHAAWTVGVLRAIAVAGIVILVAPVVAHLFQEPRAIVLIQVLAVRPVLEALASIKVADLIRNLRFRTLAGLRVPEALMNTIVAASLAPFLGVWALVAGALAGPATLFILSYVLAPYRPRFSLDRQATSSLVQFGRWIFLAGLIAVIGGSVLSLIITRQLGTAALGLYLLGSRLAFLPAEVSRQVIGDVTFPLYSQLQADRQKIAQTFQSVLTGMFALLLPASLLLIALAPDLVQHVLGPKWGGTVPVIRILAFASIIGLLGDAVVPILKGLGKPYKVVIIEGIQYFVHIACIWSFTQHGGLAGAALAWLPAVAVSQFIGIKYVRDILPHPFAGFSKPLLIILGVSTGGAFLAFEISDLIPGLMGLIIATLLAVAGMGWIFWVSDRRLGLGFVDNLGQALTLPSIFRRRKPLIDGVGS